MKILKKYANGGKSTKDDTRRRPKGKNLSERVIGPGGKPPEKKEKGNPFNTGTGSKFRKKEDYKKPKFKGRKYMGGGKMKEYGHGGKMKYENGGTNDDRVERRQEMAERRKESRKDRSRNRMRKMATDRRMSARNDRRGARDERVEQMKAKGMNTMENGGLNPEEGKMRRTVGDLKKKRSREGKRFDRKFSRKRKQYDKDVSKGRTKEMPHERTFKFRGKGDSVFKKRGKFTVENEREKKQRLDSRLAPVEGRQEARDDRRRRR
tara:strand:- start:285 stop:1076 length:792 start_codon:yes stop_codon:yes gene_type:complete